MAWYLSRYTQVPILPMYAIVMSLEMIKIAIGSVLMNKGIWIRDLTV